MRFLRPFALPFAIILAASCGDSLSTGLAAVPRSATPTTATLRVDLNGMMGPLGAGARTGRVGVRFCTAAGCGPETERTLSSNPVTDLSLPTGTYWVRLVAPPEGYLSAGVFADEAVQLPLKANETVVAVFQVAPPTSE